MNLAHMMLSGHCNTFVRVCQPNHDFSFVSLAVLVAD
jgi:hypothetical protein